MSCERQEDINDAILGFVKSRIADSFQVMDPRELWALIQIRDRLVEKIASERLAFARLNASSSRDDELLKEWKVDG